MKTEVEPIPLMVIETDCICRSKLTCHLIMATQARD